MAKLLLTVFAATFFATAGQAVPPHVCQGPAGAHNPHCNPQTPRPERAVPEPGAAAVFALGAGLIALRSRRPR